MAEPKLNTDEIENLLREAQAAAGIVDPQAAAGASQGNADSAAAAAQQDGGVAVASRPRTSSHSGDPSSADMVGDDINYLLSQAEQAIASVDQPVDPAVSGISPFQLRDFNSAPASGEKATIELLKDVDLDVRIELGRTQMYLEDVLKLRRGAVVPLEKLAGDPVDIFVNGRLIARGEVLVMNDNFCIRVAELLAGDEFK
ncbi:MAG: flagellar motor switch protein FliN [Planctomycetales bacterium]|nr:flagellar motor switch protein FliN [Planctomycetales bacterium]